MDEQSALGIEFAVVNTDFLNVNDRLTHSALKQGRKDLMYQKVQYMLPRTIRSVLLVVCSIMLSGALPEEVCGEPVDFECEVFRLVNDERAIRGLAEVTWNDLLFEAARGHSIDMGAHDTLSHTGSSGSSPSDRISAVGYAFQAYGENIAYNYPDPAAVVAGWMGSPGHRQNILNENFCELGVGLAYSDANQPYWTQNFGRPVSACPTPTQIDPCDNEAEEDAGKNGVAIDDTTSSAAEEETTTNPDTTNVVESSGSGGGGCFISVATLWL